MPTNNVQALLAQDISDPTDFPITELCQLDASCRCAICGEFFDGPVSLECGHCFCSLCIREHILREPECPHCRKSTAEARFKLNPALEELVAAWKTARPCILRLTRQQPPETVIGQHLSNGNATLRRFQTPIRNGRKRKRPSDSQSSNSDIVCVAGPSNSNKSSEIAESSPLQAKSARKTSRRWANTEPSSDPREEELESLQPDSIVVCPACAKPVKYKLINMHMDGPDCNQKPETKSNNSSRPNSKAEWSKLLGNKPAKGKSKDKSDPGDTEDRLPRVSYDVLKDKALKELLASQQLPVGGDRNTRIARHRRWVMMYNANLDRNVGRKTLPELRLELKTWEELQKGPRYAVEDPSAHEVTHKNEFRRLLEKARPGKTSQPTGDSDPNMVQEK